MLSAEGLRELELSISVAEDASRPGGVSPDATTPEDATGPPRPSRDLSRLAKDIIISFKDS
jgi:hypothetical protein